MVGEGALERQSVHGKDEGNAIILAGTGSPLLVFDILKVVIIEKGAQSLGQGFYTSMTSKSESDMKEKDILRITDI